MGLFKKSKKENSCCCGNVDSLIKKDGSESDSTCECGGDVSADAISSEGANGEVIIKILGSGCKNCIALYENVNKALEEMKLEAKVIKVTDFAEITGYGVMSTPALVVNEKVVSYGKVLKPNEVVKILEKVAL